jgi:hypothetical protein
MKASATVEDRDLGMDALMREIRAAADHVDIGVHADEGEELVKIAAAHEYGATINNPGGQPYIIVKARPHGSESRKKRSGYMPLADGKEIIFLKKGQKGMGVTKPHTIVIPMRSFIRSTVDENAEKYQQAAAGLINRIVEGTLDKFTALQVMGEMIQADIKRKMRTIKSPPLKPETIRRKGSDQPLIDHGILLGSIRYVVNPKGDE